jgi:hypothetical protein
MEKRISVFEELKRLRQELEHEKKLRREWQDKYYKLEKELKQVKVLLNQFLNANTPSSKLPPQFKPSFNERPERGTNPRGKPEGSNGATKEPPKEINRRLKAKVHKRCKKCRRKLKIEKYTKIVYDIKIKTIVTEFEVEEGYCPHCDLLYTGTHPELPSEGMIGPNLQAFFTELKHNFAGSYERISNFYESLTGIGFSHTAINDCIERVADKLEPSYKGFEEKLSNTAYSHSDETSWPVNGSGWWLWLFATMNFVFLTIQNSRARKVLTNLFGELYNGVIISDCLKVYGKFAAAFQKDWVHLLRKTHFEAQRHPRRNIIRLHGELSNMYDDVTGFLETKPTFEQRVWQSIMYHQKLQRIAKHRWRSAPAQNIVNDWLKEYEGQWLVPVIMPEISLTNNIDERGIRKVIPTRKLLGGHRTERGAKNFAIIETHRQTWKLREQSPYNMLADYLRNCNLKPAA